MIGLWTFLVKAVVGLRAFMEGCDWFKDVFSKGCGWFESVFGGLWLISGCF